jgi:hypothetical protein
MMLAELVKELPHFLASMVDYRIHKRPLMDLILCQFDPFSTLSLGLFYFHPASVFRSIEITISRHSTTHIMKTHPAALTKVEKRTE